MRAPASECTSDEAARGASRRGEVRIGLHMNCGRAVATGSEGCAVVRAVLFRPLISTELQSKFRARPPGTYNKKREPPRPGSGTAATADRPRREHAPRAERTTEHAPGAAPLWTARRHAAADYHNHRGDVSGHVALLRGVSGGAAPARASLSRSSVVSGRICPRRFKAHVT